MWLPAGQNSIRSGTRVPRNKHLDVTLGGPHQVRNGVTGLDPVWVGGSTDGLSPTQAEAAVRLHRPGWLQRGGRHDSQDRRAGDPATSEAPPPYFRQPPVPVTYDFDQGVPTPELYPLEDLARYAAAALERLGPSACAYAGDEGYDELSYGPAGLRQVLAIASSSIRGGTWAGGA